MQKFLVVFMTLMFVGCVNNSESDVDISEHLVSSLETDKAKMEEELVEAEKQIEALGEMLIDNEQEMKALEEIIDTFRYSRELEFNEVGVYRLRYILADHAMTISEFVRGTNQIDFYLEAEDIFDFSVSDDNEFVAVLHFDKVDYKNQYVEIYTHDVTRLFSVSIEMLIESVQDDAIGVYEAMVLEGFSSDSKVLWGYFSSGLDVSARFMIDIDSGDYKVFDYSIWEESEELRKQHPINTDGS